MDESIKQIGVPTDVFASLQRQVDTTQFDDVDEYVTFVLEELIHYASEPDSSEGVTDEEKLKDRLRSLGYLQDE